MRELSVPARLKNDGAIHKVHVTLIDQLNKNPSPFIKGKLFWGNHVYLLWCTHSYRVLIENWTINVKVTFGFSKCY